MGQLRQTFTPRMQTRTQALRTLAPLAFRRLEGAIADVWSVRGETGGGGFYLAPDPRIVVFLTETAMTLRAAEGGPELRGVQAFYMPPGVPLWSRLERGQDLAHIDFHLQGAALAQRLGRAAVRPDLAQPQMIGDNPRLRALAQMAAEEVRVPRRGEMVLDGLLSALLGEIFDRTEPGQGDKPGQGPGQGAAPPPGGGLTPRQRAAVEGHLRAHLSRQVTVAELAEVAGLSESWFAHRFKQQFGETPQRWQSRLRLEAARAMMADPALSLAEIAHATGFADQAHLSRLFRAAHGLPPSVWRRGTNPGF